MVTLCYILDDVDVQVYMYCVYFPGSDEEQRDLQKLYLKYEGKVSTILAYMMLSSEDDLPRSVRKANLISAVSRIMPRERLNEI